VDIRSSAAEIEPELSLSTEENACQSLGFPSDGEITAGTRKFTSGRRQGEERLGRVARRSLHQEVHLDHHIRRPEVRRSLHQEVHLDHRIRRPEVRRILLQAEGHREEPGHIHRHRHTIARVSVVARRAHREDARYRRKTS
jgi:hypothetical protein